MRHRIRSVVWRELPYSARRGIVGVLRAIDRFEDFWIRVWRSLHYSPAWLVVAVFGLLGISLTILLFVLLTRELLAGPSARQVRRPVIESAALPNSPRPELDTRLCLDDIPPRARPYPAEFGFDGAVMLASEIPQRRPPSRRIEPAPDWSTDLPPREDPVVTDRTAPPLPERNPFPDWPPELPSRTVAPTAAETEAKWPEFDAPVVTSGDPTLDLDVGLWKQPVAPRTGTQQVQVLTAKSDPPKSNLRIGTAISRLSVDDRWTWYRERRPVDQLPAAYTGEPDGAFPPADATDLDDFAAWPNRSDMRLRLELYAPQNATVHQQGRSWLVVRNEGIEPIRRLQIQEPIRPLDRVTYAEPPASLENGSLYRELRRLRSGQEKRLDLEWYATASGDRSHEARVLAETYVSAAVMVEAEPVPAAVDPIIEVQPAPRQPPAPMPQPRAEPPSDFGPPPAAQRAKPTPPSLVCSVRGRDRIAVNDVAEFEIVVTNTGPSPLHQVKIWADLPANLRHRHGDQLEYAVGDLEPGGTHRTVLRVVGTQMGRSRARIQAVAEEAASQNMQASLAVIAPRPVQVNPDPRPRRLPTGCACDCVQQVTWFAPAF